MSNLRVGLSVLAVLIGAGSVFTSNAASTNSMQQSYTWQQFDRNGNPIGNQVPNLTEQQARDLFDCPGVNGTKCAEAVNDPDVVIYYP